MAPYKLSIIIVLLLVVLHYIRRVIWSGYHYYTWCTELETENSYKGNDPEKRSFEVVPKNSIIIIIMQLVTHSLIPTCKPTFLSSNFVRTGSWRTPSASATRIGLSRNKTLVVWVLSFNHWASHSWPHLQKKEKEIMLAKTALD